jgi:hypothetical protein
MNRTREKRMEKYEKGSLMGKWKQKSKMHAKGEKTEPKNCVMRVVGRGGGDKSKIFQKRERIIL